MSMHIESAIESLDHLSRTHAYGVSYDDNADRNQVDGLIDHAFDQVMNAQTHDERGDYKAAHAALLAGTNSGKRVVDMIHANSASYDLSGHKTTLDQAPIGYKHENFS
jgi:hypothetical protein